MFTGSKYIVWILLNPLLNLDKFEISSFSWFSSSTLFISFFFLSVILLTFLFFKSTLTRFPSSSNLILKVTAFEFNFGSDWKKRYKNILSSSYYGQVFDLLIINWYWYSGSQIDEVHDLVS